MGDDPHTTPWQMSGLRGLIMSSENTGMNVARTGCPVSPQTVVSPKITERGIDCRVAGLVRAHMAGFPRAFIPKG